MTATDETPTAPRFGIGHRVGIVFAGLALLLIALGVIVSIEVGGMHTEVRRVLEEQREAGFTRDLLHSLQSLDGQVSMRETPVLAESERRRAREYLATAEVALAELRRGPKGRDPSSEEHTEQEQRLFDAIHSELEATSQALDGDLAAVAERTSRVLRRAQVLHETVRDEAIGSSNDLQRRGSGLRDMVLWTTLAALIVLGFVSWMVRRFVVRPVEALRQGVARVAGGELEHRVEIKSNDEIGELAVEFNRMSDELAQMHRELEARVEQRTQEFLRAARLAGLGTMAAGIAHEINNPLASIASCAEGLERKLEKGAVTPAEQREYLQIIAKEAYRAHDITSRLLEFARHDDSVSVPFSASDVMRELELLLEHRLRSRKLSLDVTCDDAMPPLYGNPSECKQVLLNLINNAIDASPSGGRIRLSCKRSNGEAQLEVEDQGPGIASEHIGRIFDPFFTTKAPGKGTGLGLAIVHRIVEGHGGRVEVENTGHGALFRVHVPLRAA